MRWIFALYLFLVPPITAGFIPILKAQKWDCSSGVCRQVKTTTAAAPTFYLQTSPHVGQIDLYSGDEQVGAILPSTMEFRWLNSPGNWSLPLQRGTNSEGQKDDPFKLSAASTKCVVSCPCSNCASGCRCGVSKPCSSSCLCVSVNHKCPDVCQCGPLCKDGCKCAEGKPCRDNCPCVQYVGEVVQAVDAKVAAQALLDKPGVLPNLVPQAETTTVNGVPLTRKQCMSLIAGDGGVAGGETQIPDDADRIWVVAIGPDRVKVDADMRNNPDLVMLSNQFRYQSYDATNPIVTKAGFKTDTKLQLCVLTPEGEELGRDEGPYRGPAALIETIKAAQSVRKPRPDYDPSRSRPLGGGGLNSTLDWFKNVPTPLWVLAGVFGLLLLMKK